MRLAETADFVRYWPLARRFLPYTMTGHRRLIANLKLIDEGSRCADFAAGCYVECGTWRGGVSFAAMQLKTRIAEFQFFDSFAGLPPPGGRDGAEAITAARDGRIRHDNNTASYDEFTANLARFKRPGQETRVTRGWFADTLPRFASPRPIAVLRMDGDWYESTKCILENLFDRVMPGGLVIVDDYYDWEGCAAAIHEFLAARRAAERIHETPYGGVAYLIKEKPAA